MDGWESRRKRTPGNDWCIIRLAFPGVIRGVDLDTNHFLGNAPQAFSLEALHLPGHQPTDFLIAPGVPWTEISPQAPVRPGSQNLLPVSDHQRWSHLRLHIYPDGGVARFRVYGEVLPDWQKILSEHRVLDLAAVEHGGAMNSSRIAGIS